MPTTQLAPARRSEKATGEDVYYCYRLLLGREPDATGAEVWRHRVENEGIDLEGLIHEFLHCDEFRSRRGRLVPEEATPAPVRQPGRVWKAMQFLIAGSKDH